MLLIHGTADRVLPPSCSQEIYADAREPKELRLFKGAGHNLVEACSEILDLLLRFMRRWEPLLPKGLKPATHICRELFLTHACFHCSLR